jgi:hypothetical protein
MSIAHAEQLKNELTDRFVVVAEGVPELRRFAGLTGRVKTINMNCRALVEFDGPVDIGWYDIDPSFLTVVTEPVKKAAPEKHAKAEAKPAAAKPAAAKPAGKSPLELARAQGASKAAAAPAAAGEKKLSPLELARQQGAAGGAAAKPKPKPAVVEKPAEPVVEAVATPEPEPAAAAPVAAKAASSSARVKPGTTAEIIELARAQGAFKG